VHLLVLVCVGVAGVLGLWQLHAWQDRRAAEARDLTTATPVPLADALGPDAPFPGTLVGQPVELEGTWVPGATVLISGREHEGRDGYWVVTPLAVGDGSAAIPVVRGWTPDRSAPPDPQGPADVVAWLQPPDGASGPDDDPTDDVLTSLRVADLVQRVDVDLYGAYAVAQQGQDGLEAADLDQLPPVGQFTAVRNLLYAFEWWIFGGFAVFVWWRYLRDELDAEDTAGEPAEEPVA
jgi:cytochrome oxidase assembly protein ShyY1